MRAIILSAGYGTRLWPLTEDRTKPAIPILGKPLVGYVAEYLAQHDVRDIIVNLHHQPDSVRRALGDGSAFGVNLQYVNEPVILGTSGALDNARDFLYGDTFVVINGKIITDINLRSALETHRRTNAIATLVLLPNSKYERFSCVRTNGDFLAGFGGMPKRDDFSEDDPPLMFTGIHILEPQIFDYIPKSRFSDSVVDVYPAAMRNGERIAVHVANENWYELSTIPRYLDISLTLLKRAGADVHRGADCYVSSDAVVKNSVLWDNVHIREGARVNRAILADHVVIEAGEVIEDAAVVCADLVRGKTPPEKALRGEFKGNNFVVPLAG